MRRKRSVALAHRSPKPTMPRNTEIKARIASRDDAEKIHRRAAELASAPPEVLQQVDTFFNAPHGRLKLRRFAGGSGELIFYERPDRTGPKTSAYERSPCSSPETLSSVLERALGRRGVVAKKRHVYLVGRTRIHVDDVENLGTFLELEVVLREGESESDGHATAVRLLGELSIDPSSLVSGAYIDLLENRSRK